MNWKQPIDYQAIEKACGDDKLAVTLFTHILIRARNEKGVVKFANKIVELERGQFIYGRHSVGRYFPCSSKTIDRTLKRLEKLSKLLTNQRTPNFTIVTIRNYDSWVKLSKQMSKQCPSSVQAVSTNKSVKSEEIEKNGGEEKRAKKVNPLILGRGQINAVLKRFPGLTTSEAKEQVAECNAYMAISSEDYNNPGLFFIGWLKKFMHKKKEEEFLAKKQAEPGPARVTEKEASVNFKRLSEMKEVLVGKVGNL